MSPQMRRLRRKYGIFSAASRQAGAPSLIRSSGHIRAAEA